MICIFCLTEKPSGNEHIFPSAIGGRLTIDRVCDGGSAGTPSCNSTLGTCADAPLVDHFLILIRRWELKLSGNSGKIPDPSKILLRNGVLASDPSQKVRSVISPMTGQLEPRLVYNVKNDTKPDGTEYRKITVDASTGFDEVKRIIVRELTRANKEDPSIQILSEDEIEKLVNLYKSEIEVSEFPEVNYSISIDMKSYRLGLLKIIYELAVLWLGDIYLSDPIAQLFREALICGADPEMLGLKGVMGPQDIEPLSLWKTDKDCHVAFSMVINGAVIIAVKIFDQFHAAFTVTEDAELYSRTLNEVVLNRFIHINPASTSWRQTSLSDEIARLSSAVSRRY